MPIRRQLPTCVAAILIAAALAAPLAAAEPVRLGGRAFGWPAQIEVRDLSRAEAEAAIAEAFAELERARLEARAIEQATQAGVEVALEPRALDLLRRAQGICFWSEGTVGPAGGELLRIWGRHVAAPALPTRDALATAVEAAACSRVELDPQRSVVRTVAGTTLDLSPFALGWGVDRAAERLLELGAGNFWIGVGPLTRTGGPGPEGRGWRIELPLFAGQEQALPTFFLRDRALAVLSPDQRPLRVAGESYTPYLDFRLGRPAAGVVGLVVVSELAIDALGVGHVMFVRGEREGSMLLGALPKRPSIRWLLGSGEGVPLQIDSNWGVVPKR